MLTLIRTGLALALSAAAWAGDLTITFKNTGRGNEGVSRHYFTADRHRTNHEGSQTDTMVDMQKGVFYTIKHKDKKVEFMTFDDLEKVAEAMTAQMAEMQAQLANMPDFAKKMMGDPNDFKVEETGKETVAGRACTKYHMVLMKLDTTLSADPSLKIPMNPANFARFTKFSNLMKFAGSPAASKMAAEMQKIKGYTLKSVTTMPMLGTFTSEATEVKEGPVAISVFDLPQGYKMEDVGKKMLEQARKGAPRR